MPRGPKHGPKKPTVSENVTAFAFEIEKATPAFIRDFLSRREDLMEAYFEEDADGKRVASIGERCQIMKILGLTEGNMLRFAAVREQVQREKGLLKQQDKGDTHNHLHLTIDPKMTPEEKALAQRVYLSMLNGRPLEALPAPAPEPVTIDVPAEQVS